MKRFWKPAALGTCLLAAAAVFWAVPSGKPAAAPPAPPRLTSRRMVHGLRPSRGHQLPLPPRPAGTLPRGPVPPPGTDLLPLPDRIPLPPPPPLPPPRHPR